jgi:hypothetical protein
MAQPDPLVLKNNAAVATNFTRRLPVPNGNEYVAVTANPNWKPSVTIRTIYSPAKGSASSSTRNIATFAIRRVDADDNVHLGSLSLSLVRPLATDITDADINDLYAYMAEFLESSADYKLRFNRGEV